MSEAGDDQRLTLRELVFGTFGGIHLLVQTLLSLLAFIVSASAADPTGTLKFQSFVLFLVFAGSLVTFSLIYFDSYQQLPAFLRELYVIIAFYGLGVLVTIIIGLSLSFSSEDKHASHKAAGVMSVLTGVVLAYKFSQYFRIHQRQGPGPMDRYPL
ncbi:hypothetical protein RF11_02429 [Thelohanellus kitauei]|uniref:MARVEL domain-containing protein n=1 Tax=Thelohanellus kitauei TaxID=669202 RepID=A0A0C2MRB6_THEKT|nr:hypothetical protein RF11_02429 [Thelohanellus kitauei]